MRAVILSVVVAVAVIAIPVAMATPLTSTLTTCDVGRLELRDGSWSCSAAGTVVNIATLSGTETTIGDLNPGTGTTMLLVSHESNAPVTITGMTGGISGRRIQICTAGALAMSLAHETGATTTNRFTNPGATTLTVTSRCVAAQYNGTRWVTSLPTSHTTYLQDLQTRGIAFSGPTPSISCGSNATIAGNDRRGTITWSGASGTSECQIDFSTALVNAAICTASTNMLSTGSGVKNTTTTTAVFHAGRNFTSGDRLWYHCDGWH